MSSAGTFTRFFMGMFLRMFLLRMFSPNSAFSRATPEGVTKVLNYPFGKQRKFDKFVSKINEKRIDGLKGDNENKDRGRKRGAKDTAQVRLMKLWKAEYSHRQIPHFEVAKQMVSTVEKDPEQDLNALLDEHYLAEDKKDKHNH